MTGATADPGSVGPAAHDATPMRLASALSPTLRDIADRVVSGLARLVSRAWFRRIETVGLEAISADHPVVVVANHPNGFVDPVLILATSPRPLRFLAKATLWKVPGVRWVMAFAGVLPVHRAADGATTGNRSVFAASDHELAQDGVVALFPEGTVNDALRLRPLKTGAARIALGARQVGARSLRIVPVGLVYEDKTRPRSRVLVRAGDPIALDEAVRFVVGPGEQEGPENHDAVDRLTALIAAQLSAAATDYDRGAELAGLRVAASVYLRPPDADPSRVQPMSEVEPTLRRLLALPDGERETILREAEVYRANLGVLGLRDADVVPGNTPTRLVNRVRLSSAKALVLAPVAAVGAAVNAIPFGAVKVAVATRKLRPVDMANFQMLASLVAFPVTWAGWAYVGRRVGVRASFRLAFVVGPASGHAAVVTWEKFRDVRSAQLHWRRTVRHTDLLADIRAERATLVSAVDAALAADSAPGIASPAI